MAIRTRAECVRFFILMLDGRNVVGRGTGAAMTYRKQFAAEAGALRGRNLACWCRLPRPGEPDLCHAAVLIELANAPTCEAVEKEPA